MAPLFRPWWKRFWNSSMGSRVSFGASFDAAMRGCASMSWSAFFVHGPPAERLIEAAQLLGNGLEVFLGEPGIERRRDAVPIAAVVQLHPIQRRLRRELPAEAFEVAERFFSFTTSALNGAVCWG